MLRYLAAMLLKGTKEGQCNLWLWEIMKKLCPYLEAEFNRRSENKSEKVIVEKSKH